MVKHPNHIAVVFIIIIMKKDFLVIETYMGIPEPVVSWSEMFIQNKHGENTRAQEVLRSNLWVQRVLPVTVTHAEPFLWLGSRLWPHHQSPPAHRYVLILLSEKFTTLFNAGAARDSTVTTKNNLKNNISWGTKHISSSVHVQRNHKQICLTESIHDLVWSIQIWLNFSTCGLSTSPYTPPLFFLFKHTALLSPLFPLPSFPLPPFFSKHENGAGAIKES